MSHESWNALANHSNSFVICATPSILTWIRFGRTRITELTEIPIEIFWARTTERLLPRTRTHSAVLAEGSTTRLSYQTSIIQIFQIQAWSIEYFHVVKSNIVIDSEVSRVDCFQHQTESTSWKGSRELIPTILIVLRDWKPEQNRGFSDFLGLNQYVQDVIFFVVGRYAVEVPQIETTFPLDDNLRWLNSASGIVACYSVIFSSYGKEMIFRSMVVLWLIQTLSSKFQESRGTVVGVLIPTSIQSVFESAISRSFHPLWNAPGAVSIQHGNVGDCHLSSVSEHSVVILSSEYDAIFPDWKTNLSFEPLGWIQRQVTGDHSVGVYFPSGFEPPTLESTGKAIDYGNWSKDISIRSSPGIPDSLSQQTLHGNVLPLSVRWRCNNLHVAAIPSSEFPVRLNRMFSYTIPERCRYCWYWPAPSDGAFCGFHLGSSSSVCPDLYPHNASLEKLQSTDPFPGEVSLIAHSWESRNT